MAPYMMMIVGMVLFGDVTKCVARPADIDTWADYAKRSEDYELNAVETEPSGLYGGKATGKADWKKVFRHMEIVRLSKKIEQALKNEADQIASETASGPNPVQEPAPEFKPSFRNPSPPVYGPERVVDQLLDHTGEKLPIHHSALDGWIF